MQQPEELPGMAEADEVELLEGPGEAAEVMVALRTLLGRISSPVIRACLEEATEDIAHLAGLADAA
jgi:hypothetical protein